MMNTLPKRVQMSGVLSSSGATPLVLAITEIETYHRNPRRVLNPYYDQIKESIRLRGLDQPLVVTQRPGEDTYLTKAGGNTRLSILRELYGETGEERFYRIPCWLEPWVSESDTLVAHLIENDHRGNLTFIDRALAIRELRELFEQETGRGLSLRVFAHRLREVGYSQHPTALGKMDYAVDFLWPAIPEALKRGMGRKIVEAIRRLHLAAEQLWTAHAPAKTDFSPIFQDLLRRYDGEHWDLSALRAAVEHEIAFRTDIRSGTIGLILDDLLDAGSRGPQGIPEQQVPVPSASHQAPSVVILGPHRPPRSAASTSRTSKALPRRGHTTPSLATLRRQAWRLATCIASRNAMLDLIQACSTGCGFIVTDIPALPPGSEQRERISALWWQLIACAEIRAAPTETVLPLLPPTSTLARALMASDRGLDVLAQAGVVMDPGQCGAILCGTAGDEDWADWMHLIATHRQLCKTARSSGVTLWG